jgi:uncharacterized protein YndB with AHSA1/START domain
MEERRLEFEIEIPAPKEAVWEAISTPEGIVRWFVEEARVEPGKGGNMWLQWCEGMAADNEILEWEAGEKLVVGYGGKRLEYSLTGEGGTTTLRVVHSGFSVDSKFDNEFEATFGGWSTYFAVLKYELSHNLGEPAANVTVLRSLPVRRDTIWPIDPATFLGMPVNEVARPANGYVVVSVPDLADSAVALCCEGFGEKTYLTVMAYLRGAAAGQAVAVRERINTAMEAYSNTGSEILDASAPPA